MPRPSKAERLAKVHATALAQFDAIEAGVRDERLQCLEDRRFCTIAGAQWEGKLGAQFENKPKFESNKVHQSVIKIYNEYRNNNITVIFTPKDGSKDDKLSDLCNSLYRADEQDSCAEEAYGNGFEEAISGGFGAWRLRADYEDEDDQDNDRQRIRIEPIFDADSCVFFDLNSKRQDKSDAKHCFVLTSYTRDAYKDEWDDDPEDWPKGVHGSVFDWSTSDVVYVAEYYVVEKETDYSITYKSVTGQEESYLQSELDEDEDLANRLASIGMEEVERERIKSTCVHKYILSGGKVLEDSGYVPGKCIPIIAMFGKRWYIDGIERCMGHVRLAKDPQRLKNMQLSKLAEISALSSVSKPIFTPEQVSGFQEMWRDDTIKNFGYLLVNPMRDSNGNELPSGPIAYTKPPEVPQALAALLQLTEQDLADILGSSQQGEKVVSNLSGKAVELIQTRLDMQSFIYMSNMAKAIRRTGEVWLSMSKGGVYKPGPSGDSDTPKRRKVKTIGARGEVGSAELMRPILDKETGALVYENDLSHASLDVAVEVGPSSVSRRDATVRSLTSMLSLTQDPEAQQILQSMIMMNMEGEGLIDAREYWRQKLVKIGVLKPTEEDAKILAAEAQGQPEDPNTTYLNAAAQEAQAKAGKAKADALKALADTELTRAKTADTMSSLDIKDQQHALSMAKELDNALSGDLGAATPPEDTGATQ